MVTVGVCEDVDQIRTVLARGLRQMGHECLLARDGGEALALFGTASAVEVIIMDIGLPDADGRDVVQALRSAGQPAPVLFLTALDGNDDVLAGFAAGGDDYVVKPFELRQVLARVEALARRAPGPVGPRGLTLAPVAHSVRSGSGQVLLTPTEYRMLAAVTSRPGEVVRRRTVVAAAWPDGAMVSENTIDSFIRRIRAKLESIHSPVALETVRGVGFRTVDVQVARDEGATR